jgi:hypothetical protein
VACPRETYIPSIDSEAGDAKTLRDGAGRNSRYSTGSTVGAAAPRHLSPHRSGLALPTAAHHGSLLRKPLR